MKIIITGASGSIGRALVPYLIEQRYELLLVGRDVGLLQKQFPGQPGCAYSELSQRGAGFDACVHLAVMNNDADGDLESFRVANFHALKAVFQDIKNAGCRHFINLTSFHAADPERKDPYSVSKREADAWLDAQNEIRITSLRLPAVYSESATGKLASVNKLPKLLQPAALLFLGALKPIVHADIVAEAINEAIKGNLDSEISVTNTENSNPLFRIFKKLVDWSFAASILLLAWWLLIAVFILIKITSPGPAIFAQVRVGRNGKTFICYKFRTMRLGTKQAGTHDIGHDSVTNVGAFLRKSKIDELPQIINILRGDLSLVGPRPCLPVQTKLIDERTRRGVLNVVPGITGWAQINDIDMSDPVTLARFDSDYIAQRTIPFELAILLRTFIGAGLGDRVNSAEGTGKNGRSS